MEFAEEVGTTVKRTYSHETNDEDLRKKVWDETYLKCYEAAKSCTADKHKRIETFEAIEKEFIAQYPEENPVNEALVKKYYHDVLKEASETGPR
jgi:polyribonucleotide nucleotidyltransferase